VRYLFLVCVDPSIEPDEAPGAIDSWLDRVGDAREAGGPLRGPSGAATVRVRRSERLVSDGPFAETKEFIAGFDVVECETREQAIELAGAHPVAKFGAIEVRELLPDD
jgi:hypothetical protein